MGIEDAKRVREKWEKEGTVQLKISKHPASDMRDGKLVDDATLAANIRKRMGHLAEVLELLHKIYHENKELYGDHFLAFVGNEVVRE